jgi:hypothetical protein
MSLGYDELIKMKKGDVIWNCEGGWNAKAILRDDPYLAEDNPDKVVLPVTSSSGDTEWSTTKNFEHYIPFYRTAQYASHGDDGEIIFKEC